RGSAQPQEREAQARQRAASRTRSASAAARSLKNAKRKRGSAQPQEREAQARQRAASRTRSASAAARSLKNAKRKRGSAQPQEREAQARQRAASRTRPRLQRIDADSAIRGRNEDTKVFRPAPVRGRLSSQLTTRTSFWGYYGLWINNFDPPSKSTSTFVPSLMAVATPIPKRGC